jgi:hypothetical protein
MQSDRAHDRLRDGVTWKEKPLPSMHIVAARFHTWPRAQAALRAIRERFGLRTNQAEAASFADDNGDWRAVVAGEFQEDRLPEIRALIIDEEGEIVADVLKDHTELKD